MATCDDITPLIICYTTDYFLNSSKLCRQIDSSKPQCAQ